MVVTPDSPLGRSKRFSDWLRLHDVQPEDVYRVEVEGGALIAYRYHRAGGRLHTREHCPLIRYPSGRKARLLVSEDEAGPCRLVPESRIVQVPPPDLGEDQL